MDIALKIPILAEKYGGYLNFLKNQPDYLEFFH